jgi:hypothetical protein
LFTVFCGGAESTEIHNSEDNLSFTKVVLFACRNAGLSGN